jgi:hypothetical protein
MEDERFVRSVAELAIGVDVALLVRIGAQMTSEAFVEFGGSMRAGHATQSPCTAARGQRYTMCWSES